ncbi:glycosyltransferase family 2 protein [Ruminococcus sp. 5_1_39BFAA]|uniref:glycosyltransferase family 2 protein n=1 Tax=Ruminococcus sp. 5_1_39BFAA TaxID=457412 RepID=UPI003567AFDE
MGISVIIPYYYGNKYLSNLADVLAENIKDYEERFHERIEVLFINDSPGDIIEETFLKKIKGYYRIIENEKNCGIHGTRVHGILEASQEYIWMLDQDDAVSARWLSSQYSCIKKGSVDMVIANGIRQIDSKDYPIFKNETALRDGTTIAPYIAYGNVIASPGQCLIRKEAIPRFWMEHILTENCADDMYLWMLMLSEKKNISFNAEFLYTHVATGENFSANERQTIQSEYRVIELLKEHGGVKESYLKFYAKRLRIREKVMFGIKNKSLANVYYFWTEVGKFLVFCWMKYFVVKR